MLSVKIELCPFGWYSSSPTAIVLYNRMYMCKAGVHNSKLVLGQSYRCV